MTSISWGIDWLSLTRKFEGANDMPSIQEARVLARRALRDLGEEAESIDLSPTAMPFYRYAFEDTLTQVRVGVSSTPGKQGVLLIMSGAAAHAIERVVKRRNTEYFAAWKATRMDIVFDLLDEDIEVGALYEMLSVLSQQGRKRALSIIRSSAGTTIYLGSRSSEFMLRIYDKGREQRIDRKWWRFEIECKGDLAGEIWYQLPRPPYPIAAILEQYESAFPAQIQQALRDIRNGVGGYSRPTREATSTELWFETQVIPAFGKLARKNPQQADIFLDTMQTILRRVLLEQNSDKA